MTLLIILTKKKNCNGTFINVLGNVIIKVRISIAMVSIQALELTFQNVFEVNLHTN